MDLVIRFSLLIFTAYNFRLVLSPATDECDWTDSGLVRLSDDVGGVRPVFLRCSEGRIQWRYTKDALRVVLGLGTSHKQFEGCLLVSWRAAVRISIQEANSLRLLYSPEDNRHPQLPRCFNSLDGQAIIYVEATDVEPHITLVEFRYQLLPSRHQQHQECGPCDEDRLLRLFCSCDYAVRGRMLELKDNHQLQRTEVKVSAARVYKQRVLIFDEEEVERGSGNGTSSGSSHKRRQHKTKRKTGKVHFNLQCAVKFGAGEFMFLGHMLLDSPRVVCAPRWEQWQRARGAAVARGQIPCNIPS